MEKEFHSERMGMIDEELAYLGSKNKALKPIKNGNVTRIKVTDKSFGDKRGNYCTVTQKGKRAPIKFLANELKYLLGEKIEGAKVLVVGIGNPYMTTDSLGAKVVDNLVKERKGNLYLFTPLLESVTGIPSFDVVKSVVRTVKPTFIIIVDALATSSPDRVCKSFQATDSGIVPGSAIGKDVVFNKKTLGAKVIAIGTPTVISVKQTMENREYTNMLVTPKNIDALIDQASNCIARAIYLATE